jgi:hypothetical protein
MDIPPVNHLALVLVARVDNQWHFFPHVKVASVSRRILAVTSIAPHDIITLGNLSRFKPAAAEFSLYSYWHAPFTFVYFNDMPVNSALRATYSSEKARK